MQLKEASENHGLELESRLLELVPVTGSVGNVTLIRTLADEGWSENQYWDVRQRLMDCGKLVTGRGRGGSVKRPGFDSVQVAAMPVEVVVADVPPTHGAEVFELSLAGGGRLLAVVQGRPDAGDLTKLQSLLLAHYSESGIASGEMSASATDGPAIESSIRDLCEEGNLGENDLQDETSDSETRLALTELAPERRANRNEQIEGLVRRLIQAINLRKNLVRAKTIIVVRYGLDGEGEQTLDVAGKRFDITREYVRQIEANVLTKLQGNADLQQQVREGLISWIRQVVASSSDTGELLTRRGLESLQDDRATIDGWMKLALDVAFPASGAGKLENQLIALADVALHRYEPFGMTCWVSDPYRSSQKFPNVEAWLEELESGGQALPLPTDTFATMLGVGVVDVMAVASAHPSFAVYAGYLFREAVNQEKKRAVRAHVLALHLSSDASPVSQFDLWKAYRRRFHDIDACSSNDIRIALSDRRGAPHLFIIDNNNSLFALGATASLHGLDLSPRFPNPEPEVLGNVVGMLVNELQHGPATAEVLAERLDLNPEGLISQLGQRSNFVSVTPRYYGLSEQAQRFATVDWSSQDLVEEDALAVIGCRQAGEDPQAIYPGWTPAYEMALCLRAQAGHWNCFPQLLWACEPDRWPMPELERAAWNTRKAELGLHPRPVSLPVGSRLPDAERLLRFLLVIRQKKALSMAMANRVTRPRGPLQQINGTLLAILVRAGGLESHADSYWAKHRAGSEAERLYSMLADEYLQNGDLSWTSGASLAIVQEATSNPGHGWASASEWTQRIRDWASERGVHFDALETKASEVIESDEAQSALVEGDDMDIAIDLLPPEKDSTDAPVEWTANEDFTQEGEDLAKLMSSVVAEDAANGVSQPQVDMHTTTLESVAVLVARAQSGDAETQYRLARQLQEGIGAAPNPQAAAYWLQRAADARYVPACVRLGRMLLKGEIGGGTRQERQQGLVYLNAGTKVGNATACYLVALAYRDGGLTKKNSQAAMRLLKRAARAGHGKAAFALANMIRERMDGWVPDTIKLLQLAASKGVHEAAEVLSQVEAA